ncbi:hypothetical protein M0R45_035743 [Rubus argutus]|uniref:Uncharacterized protein n=1 Tax=Rubus argutus TaxID=59490 RepID=A0AAW1VZB9_RUBAR
MQKARYWICHSAQSVMVDVPPMVFLNIIEKRILVFRLLKMRGIQKSQTFTMTQLYHRLEVQERGYQFRHSATFVLLGVPLMVFYNIRNKRILVGGMGLEGVDSSPNAPCSFLHEEIEASVFSSLIKQAAGHPQDSLVEETGIAHPTSINIDGGSQCIKDNSLSLRLQDILRLENSEDLSCAGRTMQAKGFDFGGTKIKDGRI